MAYIAVIAMAASLALVPDVRVLINKWLSWLDQDAREEKEEIVCSEVSQLFSKDIWE